MFKRFVKFVHKTQERKVALWQLQNMTDRELRDIGVSRAEIYKKVYS